MSKIEETLTTMLNLIDDMGDCARVVRITASRPLDNTYAATIDTFVEVDGQKLAFRSTDLAGSIESAREYLRLRQRAGHLNDRIEALRNLSRRRNLPGEERIEPAAIERAIKDCEREMVETVQRLATVARSSRALVE